VILAFLKMKNYIPHILLIKYGSGFIKTAYNLPWSGHFVTDLTEEHNYSKLYKHQL